MADFREVFAKAKHIAIITGAGVSAESGVPTFRGAGGFWRKWQAQVRTGGTCLHSCASLYHQVGEREGSEEAGYLRGGKRFPSGVAGTELSQQPCLQLFPVPWGSALCSCNVLPVIWFISRLGKTMFLQTALGPSTILVFLLPCSLAVCSYFDTLTVFLPHGAFPALNS